MLSLLQNWGFIGLFIGAFLAATVVPFSPDVLLVGLLMAGAKPWQCFMAATLGNWLGGLVTYGMGWLGKWEWIEKWFKVKHEKLEAQKAKIGRFGLLLAFLSWVPFVGDIFVLALGFYRVNPVGCAFGILVGKASRFAFWMIFFL